MGASDILLVGIEVSVAFAGFAGIIATFQSRGGLAIRRGTISGLALIVQYSLFVALACVLPLILFEFGLSEKKVWMYSSICAAILITGNSLAAFFRTKGAIKRRSTFLLICTLHAVNIPIVIALILNSMDIAFHRVGGPYLVAATYPLIMVGYNFSYLLLKPLWRSLEKQEELEGGASA